MQVLDVHHLILLLDATYRVPCMLTLQPLDEYDYNCEWGLPQPTAVFPEVEHLFLPHLYAHVTYRAQEMFRMEMSALVLDMESQLESAPQPHIKVCR